MEKNSTKFKKRGSKSVFILLLFFVTIFSNNDLYSQVINATTYPRATSSGVGLVSYTSLGTLINAGDDDGNSALTNIGFDFWFNGVRYTQFGANTNGHIRLGAALTTTAYVNNLADGAEVPNIAPFWDDLTTGTNGYVRYGVNGTAPNRTLVVEWRTNQYTSGTSVTSPSSMTFQAILSETTGRIQYIYGAGMTTAGGYSIGFSTSTTNLVSMETATDVATYGSDPNSAQTTAIASGKSYTFTPDLATAPTGLTFSNVTSTSMNLGWTDNSSNESGYVIYTSTNNINFTFNQQVAANSTTASITGLTSGTLYYFRVYSVTGGALSSPILSGSQATLTVTIISTSGNGTWVAPSCVSSVTIELWGAGGGGGNSATGTAAGGSGGGGGAYARGIHSVTSGSTYHYNVGAVGTGGPASSTALATAGGSSWFNATAATNSAPITNTGGTLAVGGGIGINNSTANPANGGAAASSLGNVSTASGTSGAAGANNGGGAGGAGANPGGGAGGAGSTNNNGTNGTAPGGGGGGSDDAANRRGGDGGLGRVSITYQVIVATATPVVSAPICAGSTSISGTSTEPNGTTIELFKSSVSIGTTTVTGGVWNITGLTALVAGDVITATATSSASCRSVSVSSNPITVIARPTVTFTAQPGASVCASTDVTYTTQSGQSNYVWTLPGVLNTDYSITSGGIGSTSNTVTLRWLTAGSKTVTINYNNAGGCNAASATSSIATTVNPLPTASISGNNGPICSGANATFTLTGTTDAVVTYNINGGSNTTATLTGGTATVTITGATSNQTLNLVSINNPSTSCNQSLSGSSTVTVNPLPTASISGNNGPAVCSGSDITFNLTGTSGAVVTYNLNGDRWNSNSYSYCSYCYTNLEFSFCNRWNLSSYFIWFFNSSYRIYNLGRNFME